MRKDCAGPLDKRMWQKSFHHPLNLLALTASNHWMTVKDDKIRQWLSEGKSEMAFRAIVRMSSRPLYRMIRRMAGDHLMADDILQNIYLKVFEKIDSFEWRSGLYTWIYRIAVNEVLQCLRKEKKHLAVDLEDVTLTEEPRVDFEVWMKRFEKAVSELPDQQRMVFILRYYEEKSYKEIAELMERSEGAMKANYHHAVGKIRSFVERNVLS